MDTLSQLGDGKICPMAVIVKDRSCFWGCVTTLQINGKPPLFGPLPEVEVR